MTAEARRRGGPESVNQTAKALGIPQQTLEVYLDGVTKRGAPLGRLLQSTRDRLFVKLKDLDAALPRRFNGAFAGSVYADWLFRQVGRLAFPEDERQPEAGAVWAALDKLAPYGGILRRFLGKGADIEQERRRLAILRVLEPLTHHETSSGVEPDWRMLNQRDKRSQRGLEFYLRAALRGQEVVLQGFAHRLKEVTRRKGRVE